VHRTQPESCSSQKLRQGRVWWWKPSSAHECFIQVLVWHPQNYDSEHASFWPLATRVWMTPTPSKVATSVWAPKKTPRTKLDTTLQMPNGAVRSEWQIRPTSVKPKFMPHLPTASSIAKAPVQSLLRSQRLTQSKDEGCNTHLACNSNLKQRLGLHSYSCQVR
jgi:hypothetical protein